MAFTAVVGKSLMEINHDPKEDGKTILSTYSPASPEFKDDQIDAIAEMKTSRPPMKGMSGDSDPDQPVDENLNEVNVEKTEKKDNRADSKDEMQKSLVSVEENTEVKRRFRDSLNALEIEEAKATGRAQLGLAFGEC